MKNLIQILSFLLIASISFGQNDFETGHIIMEMTQAESDNEDMAMAIQMMQGTETNYYFNDDYSLVKQSLMGGMVEIQTLLNKETKDMSMYFNMMGQKMLVETNQMEMEMQADSADVENLQDNVEIVYDETDTKEILGYDCYKATITNPSIPEGFNFDLYISEDVKASNKMIQGLSQMNLKGFPLELNVDMGELVMVYTTTAMNENFNTEVFSIDSTGYQVMTMEEFQNSMGQMGGGFGF